MSITYKMTLENLQENKITFLTVPGRAPWTILIDKSVNLIFFTLTVCRLQAPSSTRSLKNNVTASTGVSVYEDKVNKKNEILKKFTFVFELTFILMSSQNFCF